MYEERDESITHLIAKWKKLAQIGYKQQPVDFATIIQLELCQKVGLIRKVKWCNHKPETIVDNDIVKILWNFNIQIDNFIQHTRPGIDVLHKIQRN